MAHMWQLTCTVITIWWKGALTCGMCSSRMAINVHGNYYYMVEESPHMWQLTCTVITIWWMGALMCGINVHSNYYYMVEGGPHVWLTCGN